MEWTLKHYLACILFGYVLKLMRNRLKKLGILKGRPDHCRR